MSAILLLRPVVVAFLLLGTLAPLDAASAHFCLDVEGVTEVPAGPCDPHVCVEGEYHDHFVVWSADNWQWCRSDADLCGGPQRVHAYYAGGGAGAASTTAFFSHSVGDVVVWDTNGADCDGDGVPGDFDGDYDFGVGGGFFGYGPWADEDICDYGLDVHGRTVAVTDTAWGFRVAFRTGANDAAGPIIITDLVDPSRVIDCETDGTIAPDIDSDDCLSPVYVGSGDACGAGGDGGYWVIVSEVEANEAFGGVTTRSPATRGWIMT